MGLGSAGRFWVAVGALALALVLLAPSIAPLSGSMDAFAQDLANGSFRPFGQPGGGKGALVTYGSTLGGFTGASSGNYMPGAGDVPRSWTMDRDGRGGVVIIDSVCSPDLGAMKRLKAYDRVATDGETLTTADSTIGPLTDDTTLRYDATLACSFPVSFRPNEPIPIFSPHPKARIQSFSLDPPIAGVRFFRDKADTLYAYALVTKVSTLNLTFVVSQDYYSLPHSGARASDYAYSPLMARPVVPADLARDAKLVLARAGVKDTNDIDGALGALSTYFRSFTEGDIPPPTEVESLYLALALGGHGCCRHRAFAFMVTAQSIGVPTRAVVNEAHAFVEVELPDGHWHQINLGGCGTYQLNNPNKYPSFFDQATSPRTEANSDENDPAARERTSTNITDAPTRIVKGEAYVVSGTVLDSNGRGVPGARIDLYLNDTKTTPGRLTGAGSADAAGLFSIEARVPADAPARGYQLVARGTDGHTTTTRYDESWSDPSVDVFAPTRFILSNATGAARFPLDVSGRLTDVDMNGVPNVTIEWSLDERAWTPAATNIVGLFSFNVTEQTVGTYPAYVRFTGNAHHGPASATATLRFAAGAILLPTVHEPLVRGESLPYSGALAISGVQLAGHAVQATVAGSSAKAITDDTGHFTFHFVPPDATPPGAYPIRVEIIDLGLNASTDLLVAARARLDVDAPPVVAPGDAWVVTATLTSDNGTRIASSIVRLAIDGDQNTSASRLTNRTGVVRFEMPPGALAQGPHSLRLVFPGDMDHVPAIQTLTLRVDRPWYANLPVWAFLVALGLVLVLAIVSTLLRKDSKARAFLRAHSVTLSRPQRRFLAIAFPDHPPGVAPVFEPGERGRVRLTIRDRQGKAMTARVGVVTDQDARANGRAQAEAGVTLDVPAPTSGTKVTLRAHALGVDRLWTRPIELQVPVASYRAAVESGFVALRKRAGLASSATPGELVASLAPRLDARSQDALRQVAALFELADYSETSVDRAFYHSFARAASDVTDPLEDVA
ncbi:MAG: hypothetical protein WDA16_11435 [Candidatus Thermoplasmatota archaeon]